MRRIIPIWAIPRKTCCPSLFRNILIATDGVFSMNGDISDIKNIVELAGIYNALVMVDDSHATGFLGKIGRGSIEYNNVFTKVGRKHGVI